MNRIMCHNTATPDPTMTLAQALNEGYACQTLDPQRLRAQLAFHPSLHGLAELMTHSHPNLFSNANAGGAFLNAALARSHHPCCEPFEDTPQGPVGSIDLKQQFLAMFQAEWHSQRGEQPLRSVVIVDDEPLAQYLAPEFELCRQVLTQQGIWAQVADPSELTWRDGCLWHGDTAVDMVYNRLTDFYLEDPRHGALREAYLSGATVLSPHPRGHALLAEKGNLVALSQADLLQEWGATAADQSLLSKVVPHAVRVTAEQAEALWRARRRYFFKPVRGYGSKAAYRGDKLTHRVWNDLVTPTQSLR